MAFLFKQRGIECAKVLQVWVIFLVSCAVGNGSGLMGGRWVQPLLLRVRSHAIVQSSEREGIV